MSSFVGLNMDPCCGYNSDLPSDSSSENLLQLILDEDERKRKLLKAILLATVTLFFELQEPEEHFYCDRLQWMEHAERLNFEGPNAFFAMYRMH